MITRAGYIPDKQPHRNCRWIRDAGECIGVLCIVLLVLLAYGTLPNRLYRVLYVYSGSMLPAIAPGDLIVVVPPPAVLEPGSILTLDVNGQYVTHRLQAVQNDGKIITQGDNNAIADDWGDTDVKVVGKYFFRIPKLGYLAGATKWFKAGASGSWFISTDSLDFSISTLDKKPVGTSIKADLSAAGLFDETSGLYGAEGKICVTNQGEAKTSDLRVNGQVEYNEQGGSGFKALPNALFNLQPAEPLLPGETRCLPYRILFVPVEQASYRMTAFVTITNHSGWLPGGKHCPGPGLCPFGPTVKSGFELPAAVSTEDLIDEIVDTPTPEVIPETPVIETPTETPTECISETPTETLTETPTETPSPEQTDLMQEDPGETTPVPDG